MNNLNDIYESSKCVFVDNLFFVTLVLFVVIYIIHNYEQVMNGNIFGGNIVNSVLSTGILVLLLYILFTWNEDDHNNYKVANIYEGMNQNETRYKVVNNTKKIFIPYNEKHKFGLNF